MEKKNKLWNQEEFLERMEKKYEDFGLWLRDVFEDRPHAKYWRWNEETQQRERDDREE